MELLSTRRLCPMKKELGRQFRRRYEHLVSTWAAERVEDQFDEDGGFLRILQRMMPT